MLNLDLRGDKRKFALIEDYDVTPVLAVKLPEIKFEQGCCGPVTEEFHVFRVKSRKTSGQKSDYIVMGPSCAKSLYLLLNVTPNKPLQPTVAFQKGSDIPEIYHRLCPFNRQLHDAIWLLSLSWRMLPKHHLLEALQAIYARPDEPVPAQWAEKFAATLKKDRQGRGMVGLMADLRKTWPQLRWFSFEELEAHLG